LGRSSSNSRLFNLKGIAGKNLLKNIYEAVEACLSVDVEKIKIKPSDRILDVST
jgi:hypothetical protein